MPGDLTRSCGEIRWREQGDPLAELEEDFNWKMHRMTLGLNFARRIRREWLRTFIEEWRQVHTKRCLRRAVHRYAKEQNLQRTFAHWLDLTLIAGFDPDHY